MDLDKNVIKLPVFGKISIWAINDLENIQTNTPYQIKVFKQPLEVKDNVHLTDHRLY